MSTKGRTVTAIRKLEDDLRRDYEIPLLVLHDFNKVGTLQRDNRRHTFTNKIRAIDPTRTSSS